MEPGQALDGFWQQSWLQLPYLTKLVRMLSTGKSMALEYLLGEEGSGCTWEPHLYPSPLCPGIFGDVYYILSISQLRLQSFLQT